MISTNAQSSDVGEILTAYLSFSGEKPVLSIITGFETPDGIRRIDAEGVMSVDGRPVGPDSRFRIASVTKTMTAVVIMQLAEELKLRLEDQLVDHLNEPYISLVNEFKLPDGSPAASSLTLKHLLTHTSGLGDMYSDRGDVFFSNMLNDPARQFNAQRILQTYIMLGMDRLVFEPDEKWRYSDMNYVLLGLVIENIEQASLESIYRQRIIEPLELSSTFLQFYEPVPAGPELISQYFDDIDMSEVNSSFDWAGGGIASDMSDMLEFFSSLFEGKLIETASLEQMMEMSDTGDHSDPYGMGLFKSEFAGLEFYGHYGFYGTYAGYCPGEKVAFGYNIAQVYAPFDVREMASRVLERYLAD